jgi:hypothetical protein
LAAEVAELQAKRYAEKVTKAAAKAAKKAAKKKPTTKPKSKPKPKSKAKTTTKTKSKAKSAEPAIKPKTQTQVKLDAKAAKNQNLHELVRELKAMDIVTPGNWAELVAQANICSQMKEILNDHRFWKEIEADMPFSKGTFAQRARIGKNLDLLTLNYDREQLEKQKPYKNWTLGRIVAMVNLLELKPRHPPDLVTDDIALEDLDLHTFDLADLQDHLTALQAVIEQKEEEEQEEPEDDPDCLCCPSEDIEI